MSKTLIKNIGCLFSGDIARPVLDADGLLIEDGKILKVGRALSADGVEAAYDAAGLTLMPCLVDSHVHVAISEWAPRQNAMDWLGAYAAAGITGIISAGETHIPGRPSDPQGVKALATLTRKIFAELRPGGAKVYAGAVIPVVGLTEQDFKDLADIGVNHTGEIGLGDAVDPETAGPMAEWGRKYGLRTLTHTGAAFLAGSAGMNADRIVGIKPDVVCHVAGGGIPVEGMRRLVEELPAYMEICAVNRSNPKFMRALVDILRENDAFSRLILGTDSPSGYGVFPHGVWEVMALLCGACGLEPEIAVAAGSGNTAACYGLESNMIKEGYAADLILCDAPLGAEQDTAADSLRAGTVPGVSMVFMDGEVLVSGAKVNTAPPKRVAVSQRP
ncbi:MAG: amidohydrolase family protein [Candidatus Adiutrix sp.]|jgi:enamidase|nr:amidohydrolase family protein [Candidatus Adiutrix sp.]